MAISIKKQIAKATLSVFALTSVISPFMSVYAMTLDEKAQTLWIVKDANNNKATFIEATIMWLRTQMLLDYKKWLVIWMGDKITGNSNIDTYLNTAKILYNVSIPKDPSQPLNDNTTTEIKKIVNVEVKPNETKSELASAFVSSYDNTNNQKFDNLENQLWNNNWVWSNTTTNDNWTWPDNTFSDLLNGFMDDNSDNGNVITGSNNTENTITNVVTGSNNTESDINITTGASNNLEVTATDAFTLKISWTNLSISITDKDNNNVTFTSSEDTVNNETIVKLTNVTPVINLSVEKNGNNIYKKEFNFADYVKTPTVSVENNYKTIGKWFNIIAKVYNPNASTLKVKFAWLFTDSDFGNILIMDKNYKTIKRMKLRHDIYNFDLQSGEYIIAIQNKTATSQVVHAIFNDKDEYSYSVTNSTLWQITVAFNAESTPNKEVNNGIGEKINLIWTISNVGDHNLSVKKISLHTDGNADITEDAFKIWTYNNWVCTINDNYSAVSDWSKYLIIAKDVENAISLNATETKDICVQIDSSKISWDENEKITFTLDSSDASNLFFLKDFPSKFLSFDNSSVDNVNTAMTSSYGTYTIKSSSLVLGQASTVKTKVPVWTDTELYEFSAETFGDMSFDNWKIVIQKEDGSNFATNDIANIKLIYKASDWSQITIDTDTNPIIQNNTLTASFDNQVKLKPWKGLFIIKADVSNNLDWKLIKVSVNNNDIELKNKDDNTINPINSVISPDLTILKGEIDFSSIAKTRNVLINKKEILWTFTIQNLGVNTVKVSSVKINTLGTIDKKVAIAGIGYVNNTNNDGNIITSDVTMLTDYKNISNNSNYLFALNNLLPINIGESKTIAIVWQLSNTLTGGLWHVEVNSGDVKLVTPSGTTMTNDSSLTLDTLNIKESGKAYISLTNNVKDFDIVSPSNKYVSLGELKIDPKYEDVRLNKLTFNWNYYTNNSNSVQNWLKDMSKLYIVKKTNDCDSISTIDPNSIAAIATVWSNNSYVASLNNIIPRTDNDANGGVTEYCVYWKILTNEAWFEPAWLTTWLKMDTNTWALEVYGKDSWTKYDNTSLLIQDNIWKKVTLYPSILTFNGNLDNTVTAGVNKKILNFSLVNTDDRKVKVKSITFNVASSSDIMLENVKLNNSVTNANIATKYMLTKTANWYLIEFDNLNLVIDRNTEKDYEIISDIDTKIDKANWNITLIADLWNTTDTNKAGSFKYVALDDSNNEIPYKGNDVWFVKDWTATASNDEINVSVANLNDEGNQITCSNFNVSLSWDAEFFTGSNTTSWTGIMLFTGSDVDKALVGVGSPIDFANAWSGFTLSNVRKTWIGEIQFDWTKNATYPVSGETFTGSESFNLSVYTDNCYDTTISISSGNSILR